jgi:WhiB family redox-sensing transcriptional regulator
MLTARRLPPGMVNVAPMPALAAAACRGADPAVFFPVQGAPVAPAKAICAACPELEACRRWALGEPMLAGVWGGTSEHERRTLRRRGAAMSEAVELGEVHRPRGRSEVGPHDGDASPATCSVCGGPIAARSLGYGARTCSARCRTEARRRRQRAGPERAPAPTPQRSEVTRAPEAVPAPAAQPNGAHGPTGRLGPIYEALALAGATVVRVELEVTGERWVLTRAQGGHP